MKKLLNSFKVIITILVVTTLISCSNEDNFDSDTNDNNNNVSYFFKAKIDGNQIETTNKANCVYTQVGTQLIIQGSIDKAVHQFNLKLFNYTTPKIYQIDNTQQVWGLYQNQNTFISYITTGYTQTGSYIEITYYDESSKTVKGNFKFIAKNTSGNGLKTITDGSFCCYGGI